MKTSLKVQCVSALLMVALVALVVTVGVFASAEESVGFAPPVDDTSISSDIPSMSDFSSSANSSAEVQIPQPEQAPDTTADTSTDTSTDTTATVRPQQTLTTTLDDGTVVTITAKAGVLPEGTSVEAKAVDAQAVVDAVTAKVEKDGGGVRWRGQGHRRYPPQRLRQ